MKYRAEIDGLRALAVIPVILFHAGFDWISGGFVGVDIFFVISGYLITTILIEDIEKNRFSFSNFYERRARRILPALLLVILFTIMFAWVIMNPIDLRSFGNALIGVATFSSNIVFWKTEGYFSESSELNPLIHTWSLAVEEQYYVLFPVFLILCWRLGKNYVFWIVVALACLSLALSEWGWRNNTTANFYLAPTRAWELLAGSAAAFIIQKRGLKSNELLSSIGLLSIVFSLFFYDESIPFPSVYALLPVMGVVLLILFADKDTFSAKILSSKLFVGVGLISYSAYLWHQPLFAFTRIHLKVIDLPLYLSIIITLLTLALAYFSWKYVEGPFRNRSFLKTKTILLTSVVLLVSVGCMGVLTKKASDGYEYILAERLATADYVYFSNLDERKFIEGRLAFPIANEVDTLVMGSSRMMQIGSGTLKTSSLNLAVSGASVEDYVAFVGEGVSKLKPKTVILGADPWLFNKYDEQERWQSSKTLHAYWKEQIDSFSPGSDAPLKPYFSANPLVKSGNPIQDLYWKLNDGRSLIAKNGNTEAVAKKAHDGLHVYDDEYGRLSLTELRRDFPSLLNYSMVKFEYDNDALNSYKNLIKWLKTNGINVVLVLSPYHPDLYEKIRTEKEIIVTIEKDFLSLGKELQVEVMGSYDPKKIDCVASEFYDGMHPKESCMKKVFDK